MQENEKASRIGFQDGLGWKKNQNKGFLLYYLERKANVLLNDAIINDRQFVLFFVPLFLSSVTRAFSWDCSYFAIGISDRVEYFAQPRVIKRFKAVCKKLEKA